MSLTAAQVKNLSCPINKKQIKKHDSNGLFLLVKDNGSKLWRVRYQYSGKQQELALGKYPLVSLHEARKKTDEARLLLAQGINPTEERRERKKSAIYSQESLFSDISMKWFEKQQSEWGVEHRKKVKRWLVETCSSIFQMPMEKIDSRDITSILIGLEKKGTIKQAAPVLSMLDRIFRFAKSNHLITVLPTADISIKDLLGPMPAVKHMSAITSPKELSQLISDIDDNERGAFCTIQCLKLIPRIFLRPSEVRNLKWEYVDFEDSLIRLPSSDMKGKRDHLVPMSIQVTEQLKELQKHTSYSVYLFPGSISATNPISKNVLTTRLKILGYDGSIMTAHGFRSTASTLLNERDWSYEAIEAQLAHLTGTPTSRAYNRGLRLFERKKMMQWWSDYLEEIKHKYST
jgi:integrase